MTMYQITTDFACAAIWVDERGIIVDAAPIFSRFIGQEFDRIRRWRYTTKIHEYADAE